MKNIYFVQVGFEFDGSVYLPYAAGALIAYAKTDAQVNAEYCFKEILYKREKLSSVIARLENPYMVAFSCSVWNMEYCKALAKRIKEKYPECFINFGGHSVSETGALLEDETYIDILMFGEGEVPFLNLLHCLPDKLAEVKNIAFRNENGEVVKTEREYYMDLSAYPSPYTSGVFDEMMAENPDTDFLSVLETNRGCPYSCAYCDWCAGKNMRFFPLEKVKAEIDWLAEHKIEYCFCADSNFGMFERDVEIAQYLIASKKKCGYPQVFRPCYEKNSADRVFKICSALNSVQMDKGATFAYQTLSPAALENIGRKNLTMEHFSGLMEKYNAVGIPTYSELILGLPGETKESFCHGLCKLLESGQHNSLSVYYLEMLPNSDIADEGYIKKHGIQVIKVPFNHIHSAIKQNEEVQEYSYLVRSTATMPPEDWVQSNLFSICLQCFHSLGILRFIAMYLYSEHICSYYDFYAGLLSFIMNSSGKLNKLFKTFENKYRNSLAGDWNYYNERFGNITWFFEEGAFLEFVSEYDAYFEEIEPYLKKFRVKKDVWEQLFAFQKAMLRKPYDIGKQLKLHFDFNAYFEEILTGEPAVLLKKEHTLHITPANTFEDTYHYAKETVWFGRRRGMSIYSKQEIRIEE